MQIARAVAAAWRSSSCAEQEGRRAQPLRKPSLFGTLGRLHLRTRAGAPPSPPRTAEPGALRWGPAGRGVSAETVEHKAESNWHCWHTAWAVSPATSAMPGRAPSLVPAPPPPGPAPPCPSPAQGMAVSAGRWPHREATPAGTWLRAPAAGVRTPLLLASARVRRCVSACWPAPPPGRLATALTRKSLSKQTLLAGAAGL